MRKFKVDQSVNDIARFKCIATTGIGYAYNMFVEFKNLLPDSPDDSPRWEANWRRSKKIGSVSVWDTEYIVLKDISEIEKGAKVRFYLDVMASSNYCVGAEDFIYLPNSRYQATYDGRGQTWNPYLKYKGRSVFRNPVCDDETIAYYRPVESVLASVADHVYVKMGNTYFGCHGGYNDGKEMYRGFGDLEYAIQTADGDTEQFDGYNVNDGVAGIMYLFTGVCHQIANRILWTAQIVVDKAAGYRFSSLVYGPYGRGAWNPIELDKFKDAFTKGIYELYQMRRNGKITAKELVLQSAILDFESQAGEGFVSSHPGLLEIIQRTQDKIFNLGIEEDYERNPIIVEKVNAIVLGLRSEIAGILSDEDYLRIFGITKDTEVRLV